MGRQAENGAKSESYHYSSSNLFKHVLVGVVGLDELVLTDPAAETNDVRNFILLLLQGLRDHLVRLLAVALAMPPERDQS
jgi:hypothetical protein